MSPNDSGQRSTSGGLATTDHPAARPFRCHCGKVFTRVENYKRHQRQHDTLGQSRCTICLKTFTRTDVLRRHMRMHETSRGSRSQMGGGPANDVTSGSEAVLLSTSLEILPQGMELGSEPVLRFEDFINSLPLDSGPAAIPTGAGLWDSSLQWILNDSHSILDTLWTDASPLAVAPLPSVQPDWGLASRPSTPPNDANEEDKWPTNHRPRHFALGAGEQLAATGQDPSTVPELLPFQRYFIDQAVFDQIEGSLALAGNMPGPNLATFRFPRDLHTVNTFLSLYFVHFHPQLPILHLATFDVQLAPPLLLAGMICIGAGFSGLKGARAFTVDLIDVTRRSLAVFFETDTSNMRNTGLITAALITTVAGTLSGHQRTFELAEVSRGLLIHVCRRSRLLESATETTSLYQSLSEDTLEERWRRWAKVESGKRLGLSVSLIDSFFPAFFDAPSYHSQGEMFGTVLPADERFWDAPSAQAWQTLLGPAAIPPTPYFASASVPPISGVLTPKFAIPPPEPVQDLNSFAALCIVNALHHHIYDFMAHLGIYDSIGLHVPSYQPHAVQRSDLHSQNDPGGGFEGRKLWLLGALDVWSSHYYNSGSNADEVMRSGRVLYHLGHIALRVDVRQLYAAAGKHGQLRANAARPQLQKWSSSDDATHAVHHSLQLLRLVGFPRSTNSCYAPPAAFVAILCVWAYVSSQSPDKQREVLAKLSTDAGAGTDLGNGDDLLMLGAKFLGRCRAWRIGSAYMLVLAKMRGT